ncbi:hypothetical protein H5410_049093 [Solanum commersonii]|uniref:Uncharacterized protein n=1 Tax=Solanum commersonii TaxID=4109 RepID=A0A9J5XK35_SOLCO|nr:hypothetical protein H5410_049093 [Solanum commersonii]
MFLQQHRVPAGPYLFGALISIIITTFCAVMLLRPVVIDMRIMYTLCSFSIGVSSYCGSAEEIVAIAQRQAVVEEVIVAAEK